MEDIKKKIKERVDKVMPRVIEVTKAAWNAMDNMTPTAQILCPEIDWDDSEVPEYEPLFNAADMALMFHRGVEWRGAHLGGSTIDPAEFERKIYDMIVTVNKVPMNEEELRETAAKLSNEIREDFQNRLDAIVREMPMPEDTVLFQKGVAEGRRLERDDIVRGMIAVKDEDDAK